MPRSVFEHALYGGTNFETIRTFADGCRRALAPGGTVAVIFSEDSGPDRMMSLFTEAGFVATDQRTARRYFERFHMLRLQLLPSPKPAEQHG